jgi:hypothetical protein
MEFLLIVFVPMGLVAGLGLWAMFAEAQEEKQKILVAK